MNIERLQRWILNTSRAFVMVVVAVTVVPLQSSVNGATLLTRVQIPFAYGDGREKLLPRHV